MHHTANLKFFILKLPVLHDDDDDDEQYLCVVRSVLEQF